MLPSKVLECLFLSLIGSDIFVTGLTEAEHPMLYFSSRDIKNLRAKATSSHGNIVARIEEAVNVVRLAPNNYLPPIEYKKFSSYWNEVFGNNLCMLSFYCVLIPDDSEIFKIVMTYMDRMANYPDWYVSDSPKDQVPIGHSLTGFATAYDFLYPRMNDKQKNDYYYVLKNTTIHLYQLFLQGRAEWSIQYIHNHAPTNLVAFLLGSLIVSKHEPEVTVEWLKKVKVHLDFAMELFSYIIDGSVDEGVSYGSYTSRGLTQYVYLAKRHFNIDHTENPWLKEHFRFYYYTILPGFQRTVGIGDANYNWFYGPESQIVFLDAFVLKNGYGNWLADKIRSSRSKKKPLAQSNAHIWSTLHTEFLFYNSSLSAHKPPVKKNLHIFSDWGVVTLGGGREAKTGNTFFSFKSGVPNGEAVQDIMNSERYRDMIDGWKNFNAGHEHPDQNSFVFAPNGRYVVSECLYGPKFTHLDNTIVFSPSATSNCNQPWEGQIGECEKWLRYKFYNSRIRGKIITATSSDEMAFVAGDAAGAYSDALRLFSVYRGILKLNDEVLIVVDSIQLRENSPAKHASILFHNMWKEFKPYEHLGFKGASVEYPEGSYTLLSVIPGQDTTNLTLHKGFQEPAMREGPTNYVNVTVALTEKVTNAIHIFSGPNNKISAISLDPEIKTTGVSLLLSINDKKYIVKISNFYKSSSKLFEPTRERKRVTGYGGFAQVREITSFSEKMHYFGLNKNTYNDGAGPSKRKYLMDEFLTPSELHTLPMTASYTTSFDESFQKIVKPFEKTFNQDEKVTPLEIDSTLGNRIKPSEVYIPAQSAFLLIAMLLITLFIPFMNKKLKKSSRCSDQPTYTWLGIFTVVLLFVVNLYCIDESGNNQCFAQYRFTNSKADQHVKTNGSEPLKSLDDEIKESSHLTIPSDPFVLLTSLPGSGEYIFEKAFQNSSMSTYLPTRSFKIPISHGEKATGVNICLWNDNKQEIVAMGWFSSMKAKPVLHFNQKENVGNLEKVRQKLRENPNAPIVINDNDGFWMTKLPWLSHVIGKENFQSVLIVRDPRSWIHSLLHSNNQNGDKSHWRITPILKSLQKLKEECTTEGSELPFYYNHFKNKLEDSERMIDDVETLSVTWTMAIGSALINTATNQKNAWPPHVLRFEDLITDPEAATVGAFSKLGLPLDIPSLNNVIRTVKSGHYSIPSDGLVNEDLLTDWEKSLSSDDIKKIQSICGPLMEILRYSMK